MDTASEREIKILIAEGDPADAELVEHTLRKAGLKFVAERVETRSAFVEALDRFKPDIVLSDYRLPDFDELSALKLVQEKDPHLPVIVVSGMIRDDEAVELIRAGAADYVLKNRLARLPSAVPQALANAARRRENDRMEQAARHAALEIEDLYNNAPCGYHSVDNDTLVVRINDTELAWLGYTRQEVLGKKRGFDFWSPATKSLYETAFSQLRTQGGPERVELEMMRKDGTLFPVEIAATAITDGDGNFVMSRSVIHDLTERKQAEQALRDSEKAYRDLFELSPDGIVAWDLNGIIQGANTSAATLLGYDKPEDLVGRSWLDFIVPEDRPALAEMAQGAKKSGGLIGAEFAAIRKDGSRVFAEARLQVVLDSAGNPVHNIAITRDITERKLAERALQRLNRTLRVSHATNVEVVRATTEEELFDNICHVGVDLGGYRLVWIGFAEHDEAKTVRRVAWAGKHPESFRTAHITWADDEWGRGPIGTAIRTGETQINQNVGTDPVMAPWHAALAELGLKASVALPLKDNTGVFGVITLYAGEPDAFGPEEVDLLTELAADLAYGIHARRSHAGREAALASLHEALTSTVQAIAHAVEMHDVYTAGHQRHVAELAVAIAREIGVTEWQIEGIFLAGTIHDVGKLNVPAEFLSKPGKLTPLEYQLIQTHVQSGYDIIKGVNFPWPVAQTILQHHERLDGSGYPNGLKGEAISMEGRILAVADVVDAMQSHRPYRPALGLDAALAEIEAGKGRLYDPAVVDACTVLFRQRGFKFD
jgi:PAS domain S-box-containing protein